MMEVSKPIEIVSMQDVNQKFPLKMFKLQEWNFIIHLVLKMRGKKGREDRGKRVQGRRYKNTMVGNEKKGSLL